eukprot:31221-Pelagococcus_subviridis.AAC.1
MFTTSAPSSRAYENVVLIPSTTTGWKRTRDARRLEVGVTRERAAAVDGDDADRAAAAAAAAAAVSLFSFRRGQRCRRDGAAAVQHPLQRDRRELHVAATHHRRDRVNLPRLPLQLARERVFLAEDRNLRPAVLRAPRRLARVRQLLHVAPPRGGRLCSRRLAQPDDVRHSQRRRHRARRVRVDRVDAPLAAPVRALNVETREDAASRVHVPHLERGALVARDVHEEAVARRSSRELGAEHSAGGEHERSEHVEV